jgi:hypothetical protein
MKFLGIAVERLGSVCVQASIAVLRSFWLSLGLSKHALLRAEKTAFRVTHKFLGYAQGKHLTHQLGVIIKAKPVEFGK